MTNLQKIAQLIGGLTTVELIDLENQTGIEVEKWIQVYENGSSPVQDDRMIVIVYSTIPRSEWGRDTPIPPNKITAIKAIRQHLNLPLKEAKEVSEGKTVEISKIEMDNLRPDLQRIGWTVELD
jgi:hypothetical protein